MYSNVYNIYTVYMCIYYTYIIHNIYHFNRICEFRGHMGVHNEITDKIITENII